SEYIKALYAEYGYACVDCHGFVPLEQQYFNDTMLHPNSLGNSLYGEALINAFGKYMGQLDTTDWKAKAQEALA
ncbi:MAG TPA: hypothetical protein PLT66_09630, partial [Bacillota bacterium]|nr:hypothetical protein [Bacillota bacterium]